MPYFSPEVRTSTIQMLPDMSEPWEETYLRTPGVRVLRAPDCPPELAEAAYGVAMGGPVSAPLIGRGLQGKVFRYKGTALKVFPSSVPWMPRPGDASDVAANLALSVGLQRTAAWQEQCFGEHFTAPRIYAAAIPLARNNPGRKITWIMQYMKGTPPETGANIPPIHHRVMAYWQALGSCGLDGVRVDFDEARHPADTPVNVLLHKKRFGRRELVKIDIRARERLPVEYA